MQLVSVGVFCAMEQVKILVEQGVQPFEDGQIAEVGGYVSGGERNCAGVCAKAGCKAVFRAWHNIANACEGWQDFRELHQPGQIVRMAISAFCKGSIRNAIGYAF